MAYRKTLLTKVLTWKNLTDELTATFRVGIEGLPHVVQAVLEAASDGQRVGFKQASKKAKKSVVEEVPNEVEAAPKKKYFAKNGRKTRAAANPPRNKPFTSLEVVLKVMKPGEIVSIDDIMDRVIAKKWQPTSLNYRAYVSSLISKQTRDADKGTIDHVDVNQYRLRAWYVKSLKLDDKLTKKAAKKKAAAAAKKGPSVKKAPVTKSPDASLNGSAAVHA